MIHNCSKWHFGRLTILVLLLGLLISNVRAQTSDIVQRPRSKYQNSIRVDLLVPIAANISYNFWKDKGIVLPMLFTYERHVKGHWSLGTEVTVNGGNPDERYHGAALFGRYYLVPAMPWANTPLAGLYLSPVVSYRSMEYRYSDDSSITTGQRGGAGILLGWQLPMGNLRRAPCLVLDTAVGYLYWNRLGTDRTTPINAGSNFTADIAQTGPKLNIRLGVGIQF